MEKMLMTQALDERDLLVKKINDKINGLRILDTKKRNEETTADLRMTLGDFEKNAQSAWQQIEDLIKRYARLDAAIVASNAEQKIETSLGTYTVAGAIALRQRLKGSGIYEEQGMFENKLVAIMENHYQIVVKRAEALNKLLQQQAESMRLAILGKDTANKEGRQLEVVDVYVKENTVDVVDPLDVQKKAASLKERKDELISELDTKLKVSNATTTIEF